jgi:hypothetical protein
MDLIKRMNTEPTMRRTRMPETINTIPAGVVKPRYMKTKPIIVMNMDIPV